MVEKTVGLACRALYFSEFQYWMTPQVKAMLMRAMACVRVCMCVKMSSKSPPTSVSQSSKHVKQRL